MRLLNVNLDMGVVPMDWRGACIVLLYEGKADKYECSDSRGMGLFSVVGKLDGIMLIEKIRAGTEWSRLSYTDCCVWVRIDVIRVMLD